MHSKPLRLLLPLAAACALLPVSIAAQSDPPPRLICWNGAPKASCRLIPLTNFGLYFTGGSRVTGYLDQASGEFSTQRRILLNGRLAGDWGLLANVGRRDAVGLSMLASVETSGYGGGAELVAFARYRRWLGARRSLDLGIGTPVIVRNGDALRSPYGLIKYNLNAQLGVVLRPEVRRSYEFDTVLRERSHLFITAGVEVGEKAGLVLSSIGGAILGILTLIVLRFSD